MMKSNDVEVIWKPLPGSQTLALACPVDIILLCGTRGGGKTESQLMMFKKMVGRGYGPYWRGIVYDVSYKGLDDAVSKSKRLFLAFDDGAKFLSATSQYKWVWPTGEELLFRSGETEKDYMDNFHGQEFSMIMPNELTKQSSSVFYDNMMSCNRSSFTPEKDAPIINRKTGERMKMAPIPLQVVATTNPYGPGRAWVKKRFITPTGGKYGSVVRDRVEIISPKTQQKEVIERTQVALFSSYVENIHLTPQYIAELHRQAKGPKRKAWLFGDWDIAVGGAFSDNWKARVHVVPRFPVPMGWMVDRSFDWGSTHPFSTGWWALASGEEVTLSSGRKFCPNPGSLILCHEWYGARKEDWGENKGLKLSSTKIAQGIKQREIDLISNGWVNSTIYSGPADGQIYNVNDTGQETIGKKMSDEGVYWKPGDKSQGSRTNGFEIFNTVLEAAITGEGPGFYIMDHCEAAAYFIPEFQLDPDKVDDVDTKTEDHCLHGDTLVNTSQGLTAIKELVGTTGHILTVGGVYTNYTNCRMTRKNALVIEVLFQNGKRVVCTPDHKFLTEDGQWIEAQYLLGKTCYNAVSHLDTGKNKSCVSTKFVQRSKNLKERGSINANTISKEKANDCIALSTSTILEKFLKGNTSIIVTTIKQTIKLKILNLKTAQYTKVITEKLIRTLTGLKLALMGLLIGIKVKKVLLGTKSTITRWLSTVFTEKQNLYACSVLQSLQDKQEKISFAVTDVSLRGEGQQALTTKQDYVNGAGTLLLSIDIKKQNLVQDNVQEKSEQLIVTAIRPVGYADVYCLHAENTHAFSVENGIVVHNCWDMIRYRLLAGRDRLAPALPVKKPR